MHTLSEEFLVLCRQLGDAQARCSDALARQAGEIEQLRAEVVRLRAAVVVRETRLAIATDELEQLQAAHPGLPHRKAMARHIGQLAERITALSRECLRWRLAASAAPSAVSPPMTMTMTMTMAAAREPARYAAHHPPRPLEAEDSALDANLAAADLVICQTGCISHDQYWRVQDHCRRTGKPCILVDQPLAVREAEVLAAIQPMVVLRMTRSQQPAGVDTVAGAPLALNENAT